jgi:hypothetical protein
MLVDLSIFDYNDDKYEMKIIRDIFEEGLKKGVFSMADPQMTAFVILVALKGFEYM